MISYVYVLALLFFTITNGQETYWTGGGGSGNNTFSDAANWSNGPPTATSIVKINDTGCSYCDIMVDKPMTISELHLDAIAGTGPNFIISGVNVTITTALKIGTASVTNAYSTGVSLEKGGILELGKDCTATIYYTGVDPISGSYNEDNWFINRGTINVLGNGAIAAGSYNSMNIGGSTTPIYIENYGTWNVSTGQVRLQFYYIPSFDIYGGSFVGTFLPTSSASYYYATIQFYGTDVVLQPGAGADATGAGGVTFEGAVYFYSINYNSDTNFPTSGSEPNTLTFNTTGLTVSNAWFERTNIFFLYEGSLQDCNITNNGQVNSTVNGVTAHFVGNNIITDTIFNGYQTDFIVHVDTGATVTMNSDFSLIGATLINNGVFIYDSGSTLYFDVAAYWVNLGLMQVINHANDYIYGTTFPGLSTATDAGTMVNMGTIEFTNGGGLDFQGGTGKFLQCPHGILKFGYGFPATGNTPGVSSLPDCILDGWVGIAYNQDSDKPSDGASLFTFITKDGGVFSGNLKTTSANILLDPLVCVSKDGTAGSDSYVRVYDSAKNNLQCPSGSTQIRIPVLIGDACTDLPNNIKALQDTATCSTEKPSCGIDTGSATDGPAPAAGNVNIVSLAFLVSLVCLLLKF